MSVTLTSAIYINGTLTPVGTVVTLGYDREEELVSSGAATWLSIPTTPIPWPSTNISGGITIFFDGPGEGLDCSPSLAEAMATLQAGNGGTIVFDAKTYLFLTPITPPTNGNATIPLSKPLKFQGQGSFWSGQGTALNGGTIFDLRGIDAYGKIKLRGTGLFEAEGITFTNLTTGTPDTSPIIYITNTTSYIHDCSFMGHSTLAGLTCDQDAIILGGTSQVITDGSDLATFQGYGTIIEQNYFNRIQRMVYGRAWCNQAIVRKNTAWVSCGSNLGGGAMIEFNGDPIANVAITRSNIIADNLLEMYYYTYGIKLQSSAQCQVTGNGGWDQSAQCQAVVYLDTNAYNNYVVGAVGNLPGKPYLKEANPGQNSNTFISMNSGATEEDHNLFGATSFSGPSSFPSFTVAALPVTLRGVPILTNSYAFASNGRKSGEGAGAGTGCPVWFNGTLWLTFYGNTQVLA